MIPDRLGHLLTVAFLVAWASSSAFAGYKAEIGGITVSYSKAGAAAFFDADDGTLTVGLSDSGGKLKIKVGPAAALIWGDYVDIFIAADGAVPKTITVIGSDDCVPFVVGEVFGVGRITLRDCVVGSTNFYGPSFGLAVTSGLTPKQMVLKRSLTTAPLAWVTPAFEDGAVAAKKSPHTPGPTPPTLNPGTVRAKPTAIKEAMIRRMRTDR